MPKATLSFSLPEEEAEFKNAVNGPRYDDVLCKLREKIRQRVKYVDDTTTSWEEVAALFRETFDEVGIEPP